MNLKLINKQIDYRKNELIHYAPTSFFRDNVEQSFNYFVKKDILSKNEEKNKIGRAHV